MTSANTSQPGQAKTRLSRDIVLAKALELVDAESLEALTMRRLGQELGRDPMSLYRYAENRAALLDGVTELVLNQLSIHPSDPDWKAQLRKIAHSLRALALQRGQPGFERRDALVHPLQQPADHSGQYHDPPAAFAQALAQNDGRENADP